MKTKKFIVYCFVFSAFLSCKVDPKIPEILPSDNVREIIPEGWPMPVYTFTANEISENKFILGRALFYETMLSKDNSTSCGSCHQNNVAFANAGHEFSHGVGGQLGTRNSPPLFNLTWHPSFMFDGGSQHIENQPLAPIANPVEMDENIADVIIKLKASRKYDTLFNRAYGTTEINSQRMLKAIAQFMGLIYSYNSKFDFYKRGESGGTLSEQELKGYSLFLDKGCASCHKEPLFSDFDFRNNGLSVNPAFNDSGRARITGLPGDLYKFKTPSLRNIALTHPYMHDGRYKTLEECLDHYTDRIENLMNLDPKLKDGLLLTSQDKKDIIVFLNTLTDYKVINDARFKDPNTN